MGLGADATLANVDRGSAAILSPNGQALVVVARGGTWGADGWIVFAAFFPGTDRAGLLRVSSAGGTPTALTTLADGEVVHGWPQVLPGGNALLFSAHTSRTNWDDAKLVVQPLPSGERKIVQRGGSYGKYLASGHIVYLHDAKVFAVPFDVGRLQVTGPPFLALDGVGSNPNGGSAQFAASENGNFIYLSCPIGSAPMGGAPIQWMDRMRRRTPLRATPTNWGNPNSRQTAGAWPSRSTTASNSPFGCTSGNMTEQAS
jgi:hypothetical protein